MGRNRKNGLTFFPFDVDFFQDIKIRKLIRHQGSDAVTVYTLLLCLIYKGGYYMRWDEELPFIVSEQTGLKEAHIQEVINSCLKLGLFSKEMFDKEKVLTSLGIQERYRKICVDSRRVCDMDEYNLISSEEIAFSSEKTIISSEEMPINSVKSTQIKENKNKKENNTKVLQKKSETRFSPPSIEQIKEYIYSNKYNVDAERFFNFYQSKGWYVGKNEMKDWKAAVRTWVRNDKNKLQRFDIGVILTNNSTDKYNDEDKWNR